MSCVSMRLSSSLLLELSVGCVRVYQPPASQEALRHGSGRH